MMRHAITLASILGLLLLAAPVLRAQDLSFSDKGVQQLARAIAETATRTNQLPASFTLPMANGHSMVISAPNAFELFCRAIVTWKDTTHFPATMPLLLNDLTFPAPEAQSEPERDGESIPIFARDIGDKAHIWLALAEAPGHKMFNVMKFGESKSTAYRLTIGQIVVAMAVLIDQSVKDFETTHTDQIPLAIEVPLVHSPSDWNDRRTPLSALFDAPHVVAPVIVPPSLNITIEGIAFSDYKLMQNQLATPFCGTIHIDVDGSGPVAKVRLLLDGEEKSVFDGGGSHSYDLNTLALEDGIYALSAVATDMNGKPYIYICSFTVANGRRCGFTPAVLARDGKDIRDLKDLKDGKG